jgi:phosphatidylglycerophosphatase C
VSGPDPTIAAFDLDGTLTEGHSIPTFAARLAGRPGLLVAAVRGVAGSGLPPTRARYKEAVLGHVVRGRTEDEVRSVGRSFASELVGEHLIDSAADRLRAHQAMGHEIVLVSAALDVYVDALADLLGVDGVIAAGLEVVDGRCTGRMIEADLHDERKVERLRAWLGDREPTATVFSYGNSEDDEELLEYARATQLRSGSTAPTR